MSRLGVYNRASATSSYEITDHLGNVRAIVQKVGGSPVIQSFADYYPFGEQLPNRNSNSGNYRYAFQGQELDGEIGMEAFQLRLWDGRIGRWLSPDPKGQFHSPYLGMGNNPIGSIDPDGGDIIFLNDSKSVPAGMGSYNLGYFGHGAVLIGNDNDGWRYLSMNGVKGGGIPFGDSYSPDLGNKTGQNNFRGLKLTAKQVIGIINAQSGDHTHHYDRAIRIKTSGFEDGIAYQAARKQASAAYYSILGSSCVDVPQAALAAVLASRLGAGQDIAFHNKDLNWYQKEKYGFHILAPNDWFKNLMGFGFFNNFIRDMNSDLGNRQFKTTIIVGPATEIPNE